MIGRVILTALAAVASADIEFTCFGAPRAPVPPYSRGILRLGLPAGPYTDRVLECKSGQLYLDNVNYASKILPIPGSLQSYEIIMNYGRLVNTAGIVIPSIDSCPNPSVYCDPAPVAAGQTSRFAETATASGSLMLDCSGMTVPLPYNRSTVPPIVGTIEYTIFGNTRRADFSCSPGRVEFRETFGAAPLKTFYAFHGAIAVAIIGETVVKLNVTTAGGMIVSSDYAVGSPQTLTVAPCVFGNVCNTYSAAAGSKGAGMIVKLDAPCKYLCTTEGPLESKCPGGEGSYVVGSEVCLPDSVGKVTTACDAPSYVGSVVCYGAAPLNEELAEELLAGIQNSSDPAAAYANVQAIVRTTDSGMTLPTQCGVCRANQTLLESGAAACVPCNAVNTTSGRRQGLRELPLAICVGSIEKQRACLEQAACSGIVPEFTSCILNGTDAACPECTSGSKKGLLGLLGLLGLIPLCLLLVSLCCVCMLCIRRKRVGGEIKFAETQSAVGTCAVSDSAFVCTPTTVGAPLGVFGSGCGAPVATFGTVLGGPVVHP